MVPLCLLNSPPNPFNLFNLFNLFSRVAVAFEALRDPERAAVYAKYGWTGLVGHEVFMANNVITDTRPIERYNRFFDEKT